MKKEGEDKKKRKKDSSKTLRIHREFDAILGNPKIFSAMVMAMAMSIYRTDWRKLGGWTPNICFWTLIFLAVEGFVRWGFGRWEFGLWGLNVWGLDVGGFDDFL